MEIVNFIISKFLEIVWYSIWFWRISFIVIFILLSFLIRFKDKLLFREKLILHDTRTFEKLDAILNESKLNNLFNLLDYRVIESKYINFIREFLIFVDLEENQFLKTELKNTVQDFKDSIYELESFIKEHFMNDKLNNNDDKLYFEIDIKYGERSEEYQDLYKKMINMINQSESLYKIFRKKIKKIIIK